MRFKRGKYAEVRKAREEKLSLERRKDGRKDGWKEGWMEGRMDGRKRSFVLSLPLCTELPLNYH